MSAAPLALRPVTSRAEARAFTRLPALLGGQGAGWNVPLDLDTERFFDPGFNGFFATHAVQRWVAWRDGRPVGRIAAALRHGGATGSFGFLALEPAPETLSALLGQAGGWLAAAGATAMRGPLSLSINHEAGALVDGFGRPPMLRMPHSPPWLPGMLEAAGLAPAMDLVARRLDLAGETHTARFAALLARWPGRAGLRLRPLAPRHYARDIALVHTLFQDAWADNWGAEPVGAAEATTIARLMRPLVRAGAIHFAEWQGQPVGVACVLPNLEEVTGGLNGRLLPLGWLRLAPMLLTGRARSGRLPLLGIARAWRGTPVSAMALGLLFSACIDAARRRGWQWLEAGWLLAGNRVALSFLDRLGTVESGRWRLWEASLPSPLPSPLPGLGASPVSGAGGAPAWRMAGS